MRLALALAFAAGLGPSAARGQQPGVSREQMWPAPTARDWARPCLIRWQRNFADAEELARRTGRPLLICVNMDGEIASEHYAGIRYRDPAIAALYAPYVTVIASVYRHNPRDHNEYGERILCPRFGSVTCGEHIAIEPGLFETFFDGTRVAPRHVAVELDGGESFDIFYALDTQSVFGAIEERIMRDPPPGQEDRGDLTFEGLVGSTDSADRDEVEAAFRAGDTVLRRRVLNQLKLTPNMDPLALVRLALLGADAGERELALDILARETSPQAVDLIALALRRGVDGPRRGELLAALRRLAPAVPRAGTLAQALVALDGASGAHSDSHSDASASATKGASRGHGTGRASSFRSSAEATVLPSVDELTARLAYRVESYPAAPADTADDRTSPGTGIPQPPASGAAAAQLELAAALLELARHPDTAQRSARLMQQDAMELTRSAQAAEPALTWRASALLCQAHWDRGETDLANAMALVAAPMLPAELFESAGLTAGSSADSVAGSAAGSVSGSAPASTASVSTIPAGPAATLGVPRVLALFLADRHQRLNQALDQKRSNAPGRDSTTSGTDQWDPAWLREAQATFRQLVRLEADTEQLTIAHHTLLYRLWATGPAARVLDAAIRRYPGSSELHKRLRGRLLAESSLEGLGGLEASYEGLLGEAAGAAPVLSWYAGYASMVAAEHHRRAIGSAGSAAGHSDSAERSYRRAMGHFDESRAQGGASAESCSHYIAMALAGRAELALAAGDLERCLELLLDAFARCPSAAGDLDGLNTSAVSTARMLLARLQGPGTEPTGLPREEDPGEATRPEQATGQEETTHLEQAKRLEQATRLEQALAELPAEELAPPAFEQPGRGRGRRAANSRRP